MFIDSKLMMLQNLLERLLKALKAFGFSNEKNYPYTMRP